MKKRILPLNEFLGVIKRVPSDVLKCTKYNLQPFPENRFCGFKEQEGFVTEKEKNDFRSHVNKIKESMLEFGKLLGGKGAIFDDREPIIVFVINGVYYIVDGQHRYVAAMELGIPFYVRVVESDLLDSKGVRLNDAYDYAKEYFYRLNDKNKLGGSSKWTKQNAISSMARGGNKVAIHICEICQSNPLFDTSVLNSKNGASVMVKGKRKDKKKDVYACELVQDYGFTNYDEINKRIDKFVEISMKLGELSFTNTKFRTENSRLNKIKALVKNDRFTSAVKFLIDKNFPLDVAYKCCQFNSTGIIKGATTPKAYLANWGVAVTEEVNVAAQ